jgi:hypothetical protein
MALNAGDCLTFTLVCTVPSVKATKNSEMPVRETGAASSAPVRVLQLFSQFPPQVMLWMPLSRPTSRPVFLSRRRVLKTARPFEDFSPRA